MGGLRNEVFLVLLWSESQQPKAFLMDFIIPLTSTAFVPAETGQRTQIPFCSPTGGGISVLCGSHGVAPAWQVSRGSCRQVLQLGTLGKLWSSRKRIKLKEKLRTDGKSRQELSFEPRKFPWKCPCFAGYPALLSPSLLILCSPWGTFGNENRGGTEGLEPHSPIPLKTHPMGLTQPILPP